jgi:hypothetical protein
VRADEELTTFLELESVVRTGHQGGNVKRHQLDLAVGATNHSNPDISVAE